MAILLGFFLAIAVAGLIFVLAALLYSQHRRGQVEQEMLEEQASMKGELDKASQQVSRLSKENARLAKWTAVADADEEATRLLRSARATLSQAESDAGVLIADAERRRTDTLAAAEALAADTTAEARRMAASVRKDSQTAFDDAMAKAAKIIADAEEQAKQIAGKAYEAMQNAGQYERAVKAMKNIIDGYGDEYLVPAHSLLDDLAEEFGHTEAGNELRRARLHTKMMIKSGDASRCQYVEANRKELAERFVLDAFTGKTDAILSRVKHDNFGKLEQEIRDEFTLVNLNGKAFRDACVTEAFLAARLEELRWAVVAHELKQQAQEEQRRIREQIREEEKARRDFERAIRESAKEEDVLRKAMDAAQQKIEQATETQRAQYEAQLLELTQRLQAAEERNQRAISMAQQTRRGHVYIISNVGSFGEDVYKIGLTRRLDPLDRICELGDSSVPFDFDVHAMIFCEDAPAVERQLHKHFLLKQMNKVDHRKEFFEVGLSHIREELEKLGIQASWTMTAAAREYRDTLAINRRIASDPTAKEAWINRQLLLDPVTAIDNEQSDTSMVECTESEEVSVA